MNVFLDTETTGLKPGEILEIAIVSEAGLVLLDSLVKPVKRKTWKQAQAIHGISPEMVKNAPTLLELKPKIEQAIKGNELIIYNAEFDLGFLHAGGIETGGCNLVYCCMKEFSEVYGEYNEYHKNYKWQSLSKALRYYGGKFEGKAHRALSDARATRFVWQKLLKQAGVKSNQLSGKKKPENAELENPDIKVGCIALMAIIGFVVYFAF